MFVETKDIEQRCKLEQAGFRLLNTREDSYGNTTWVFMRTVQANFSGIDRTKITITDVARF